MNFRLFNTMGQKLEEFQPFNQESIRMYVCGPTVYDTPHIGNARPIVVYDMLFRLLRYLYGNNHVVYVRNITDVDDKINLRAKELGISIKQLTEETTRDFHDSIAQLGVLAPTYEPRATDFIAKMCEIIDKIIANGHGYIADDHVYFDVTSDAEYGELSGRKLADLLLGARVEIAESKRHPGDFVLWKPANVGDDPSSIFHSPYGNGRPGWHIECTAMSTHYLGENFDIHGGGADLMFPHHTNEIAQSEAAYPDSHYARYWLHNGFVTVNGEKMSKSLGNFITVKELLEQGHDGLAIKLMLLSTHYRKPFDFNDKALLDAHKSLSSFKKAIQEGESASTTEVPREFLAALCDDLNTPLALSYLHNYKAEREIGKLKICLEFLGITIEEKQVEQDLQSEIEAKLAERAIAKQSKDWARADMIREELAQRGIILEDTASGTKWFKK